MLGKHILTIILYVRFYQDLIKSVFANGATIYPKDYYPVTILWAGYTEAGYIIIKNGVPGNPISPHHKKLNEIFSPDEFKQIQLSLKDLYCQFKKEIEVCKIDFLKDRSAEESNENFVEKFITELAVSFRKGNHDEVFGKYSNTDSISKLTSWYAKDRLYQITGTPAERLFLTISKSFLYIEILHHAGFFRNSKSEGGSFEDIVWRKIY